MKFSQPLQTLPKTSRSLYFVNQFNVVEGFYFDLTNPTTMQHADHLMLSNNLYTYL